MGRELWVALLQSQPVIVRNLVTIIRNQYVGRSLTPSNVVLAFYYFRHDIFSDGQDCEDEAGALKSTHFC